MDDYRTVWCGNLSEQVTEDILYELFLQAAPLINVKIPKDKDGRKANYGFITLKHPISVDYTIQLLNGTRLFDRVIQVKRRTGNVNANSFSKDRNVIDKNETPKGRYRDSSKDSVNERKRSYASYRRQEQYGRNRSDNKMYGRENYHGHRSRHNY